MVGDSATDIATAKAAQIPSVAVSFGYTETPAAHLGGAIGSSSITLTWFGLWKTCCHPQPPKGVAGARRGDA